MKHFLLFKTKSGDKLSLPVEDINYIENYTQRGCATVHTEKRDYYVLDDIEVIVKRINQIVYGTKE